ncbi:MAG: hypothetical protein ACOYON_10400 [Fimbriimonas sp.]
MTALAIVSLLLLPTQRGRAFVSVEAHVGTATGVYVGHVKSLAKIDHEKPNTGFYPGDPHKVTFEVDETIKGPKAKSLDLILTLQNTFNLTYLRENQVEVMLVASSQYVDEESEVGLEPLGSRYSFRILKPVVHPEGRPETKWIGDQFNISQNAGRMFDINLNVLTSRNQIFRQARAFAKKYPGELKHFYFIVPNEFGVKCGYTNAFCGITLPLCPESQRLMQSLRKDPSRLLRDVKPAELESQRSGVTKSIAQFLSQFELQADSAD